MITKKSVNLLIVICNTITLINIEIGRWAISKILNGEHKSSGRSGAMRTTAIATHILFQINNSKGKIIVTQI